MSLPQNYTIKQKSIVLAFLVCIGGVFYFSWLPNSSLTTETYLPSWLRNWCNTYFNLRTAIPFVPLGYLLASWASIPGNVLPIKRLFPLWISTTLIATVVVCLAEGGQFFISHRHPDLMDVGFGLLGSLLGRLLHYLSNIFIQLIFTKK